MENELLQLTTIAVVLAPIVAGITQLVKQSEFVNGRWINLVAIFVGILMAGLWSLAFSHIDQLGPYLLAGLLSGLSASGVYDVIVRKGGNE